MKDKMRMIEWLLISLALLAVIAYLFPEKFTLSVYKFSLITTAAWVGYWIDRSLFPYSRPHLTPMNIGNMMAVAMLRRAIIVGAAMLAASLGM